ncbi:hypothetical protein [Kocuria arenosa]
MSAASPVRPPLCHCILQWLEGVLPDRLAALPAVLAVVPTKFAVSPRSPT